jgi:transposase
MWTTENRARYDRNYLRYPSDLTDAEWALIEPGLPPAKPGGNKRTVNLREIANGLMYILSTGCQWRAIPKDLPPRSTLHDYFDLWSWDGTLDRIHHALRHARPCTIISICGAGTARSIASITRSMSNVANARSARLPRRPRSSTARA